MALINKLSAIGNAIRTKTGKTDLLTLDQMPEEIAAIETMTGSTYEGEYEIIPSFNDQLLETEDKLVLDNITVQAIPYSETPNDYGTTVSIAQGVSAPYDTLKALLDTTKSTYYMFYEYTGTSVDGLISYNATENDTMENQK